MIKSTNSVTNNIALKLNELKLELDDVKKLKRTKIFSIVQVLMQAAVSETERNFSHCRRLVSAHCY